ncbi:MAG: biotin transporter BioY [Ruminococcus flavefaciens]|nr:biotin transporter BioY [Ruminococcus flavefaciens]
MEKAMSIKSPIFSVKRIALAGLLTAVICVLSPFALHIPISPVPISLGMLAIYFVVSVAGRKLGTISVLIYILLGLVGVPVFTDFTAGPGKLLGPTGGYIIGYIFLALISGFFVDRFGRNLLLCIPGMVLGTCVCYLFGTLWLQYQMQLTFPQALLAGVIPYIPADLVKLALAMTVGSQIRKRLVKAGLIDSVSDLSIQP